ncbi:MAG: peptidylprolyl isomerase [Deltaproteobacteria bacterium]|nr:peptidylprolyl isomerase [Deltaproteobacteria bacterium]
MTIGKNAKNGDYVQIHYTGTLEDHSVFDSSENRGPLEFQLGGGRVIPGFNDAVLGMSVQEEKEISLHPDQAYGDPHPEAIREFPAEVLKGHQIQVGQVLGFNSPQGPVHGRVLSIDTDKFLVDFNHPLAGKTLTFKIKLVGITDAPTQASCGCGCPPDTDCGTTCG